MFPTAGAVVYNMTQTSIESCELIEKRKIESTKNIRFSNDTSVVFTYFNAGIDEIQSEFMEIKTTVFTKILNFMESLV